MEHGKWKRMMQGGWRGWEIGDASSWMVRHLGIIFVFLPLLRREAFWNAMKYSFRNVGTSFRCVSCRLANQLCLLHL